MQGTTVHEFGHSLGLLHEQSYPRGIKWNKDTVYKYYAKYQGWDKEKVDFNVMGASDIFTQTEPLTIRFLLCTTLWRPGKLLMVLL